MSSAHAHRRIAAPVERVWAAATDVAGACERMSGIQAIELITEGPFRVGSRWRETRTAVGLPAIEEMRVVECEPPHRFAVDAHSGGAVFRSATTFTPMGAGATEVSVVFDAPPPNVAGRIVGAFLGTLAARTLLAALNRDLDDLARWCERRREADH